MGAPSTVGQEPEPQYSECKTCRFFHGLDVPAIQVLPPNELLSKARSQSIIIFRSWINLHTILKRFEDVIRKRWSKKNDRQRVAILSEAWPGVPATHRPDFDSLRHGCKRHRKAPEKEDSKLAYLWPFINLEDLVKPPNLLTYLNARGHSAPWRFAFVDKLNAHIEKHQSLTRLEPNGKSMLLWNQTTPKSYGKVQQRTQSVEGCLLTTGDIIFEPNTGLQVLEIQARILGFLLTCTRLIMRDHCLENIHSLQTIIVPPLSAQSTTSISISELAAEAPYRVPQNIDMFRLLAVVKARVEAAEDHVWALREDPGYFAQELREWGEHTPARVPDTNNMRPHEMVGSRSFWSAMAADMISHAYGCQIMWDDACHDLIVLADYLRVHGPSFDAQEELHPVAEQIFRRFDRLMQEMQDWPLRNIMAGCCGTPSLRGSYRRASGDVCPSFYDLSFIHKADSTPEGRLHKVFKLLGDPAQQDLHGHANIVEELHRTLEDVPKTLVTSWMAERFSDLALITEIRRQINMFEPFATTWRQGHDIVKCCERECETHAERTFEYALFEKQILVASKNFPETPPSAYPYPCDKRCTEAVVDQMRASERKLDHFWDQLDCFFELRCGFSIHEALAVHFLDPYRDLQRTPKWKAPKTVEVKSSDKRKSCGSSASTIAFQSALADIDPNARNARPSKASLLESTPTKNKVKTHGLASPSNNEQRPKREAPKPATHIGTTFLVSRRHHKVFTTLFHNTDAPQSAGEIPWIDFVHAMGSLDFSAEKLYGSSWQFTPPPGTKTMHPIQFHEPHPGSKMRFWEAKKCGRRLTRTYGWKGEMFKCK